MKNGEQYEQETFRGEKRERERNPFLSLIALLNTTKKTHLCSVRQLKEHLWVQQKRAIIDIIFIILKQNRAREITHQNSMKGQ